MGRKEYIKPLISWWQRVCAKSSLGDLFIDIVKKRDARLTCRLNAYAGSSLPPPSTIPEEYRKHNRYDRIEADLATQSLRMFDELLYVLFPYITEDALKAANTREHLIQRDIGLMQFLGRLRSVTLDPDSTL